MSNNGSNFDKFTDSKHDVKQSSGSATPTATNLFTDNTIRTRWSTLSMASNNNNNTNNNNNNDEDDRVGSPLLQPPYSSIKKLDLFTKRRNIDNHSLFSDSSSSKRFKIGDDFSDSQPLSLKRSTSRVSTPSTTTSGRSFSEFRYLQHLGPITGRDSPSSNFRNLNLSSEQFNSRNESHFYSGKTTFGGANLRKTPMLHRRFSATPYSKINVKCIEPRQSAGRTNSNSPQDLPLSSVTQRILDRLEKAATPIQDAKSRIPALINQKQESREKSRLFDTPNPSLENKGRFNVDFSHKPLKYVLQTNHDIRTEREDNDESAKISDKSIERDLEKLIQIKKAEQELQRQQEANNKNNNNNENRKEKSESDAFVSKKNISIGKITSRDVKKGWKTESSSYVDDDHLKSLANVQPLTITSELKPITLKSTQLENNQQHSNIIDKNSDKKPFGNCDNVVECGENLHKDHESIFKFSSPKLVANLSRDVSPINEKIKFSSPLNVSASSAETKSIFGQRSVSTGDLFKLPDQEKPLETKNSNATSLFDLFKNKKQQSNLWPCPTCCTENDAKVEKCIACEEINPNHEKSSGDDASKTSISSLKFGNLSQIKSAPSVPLNQLFKKDPGNTWTCPTCSVSNNVEQNVCVSCEEPNPSKKSIDSKPNESNKIDTGFKFGSFSQTAFSDAKNQMEKPIVTDISKPSLAELFKKDQNSNSKKWTCQTCMVSNDSDVAKCVSCEEPNPNGGGKQAETSSTAEAKPAFGFKFGSFDGGKIDSNLKTVETSNKKPQAAATGGWKCFYCQAMNQDDTKNVCQECKKIKVMAATKDQVQKFYQFQTFKFGSKIEKENQIENIGDNVAVNSTESNQTSANTEGSDQSSKNKTSLFKLDDVDSAEKKTTSTFERQPNTFAVSNSNFPKFGAEKTKIDFKFGDKPAASGIDLAAPFKFVPPQSTNTTELKFGQNVGANKPDSNESNTKVPGLFSFGSTIAPDVTNLETIATVAASLIDSRQPSSSFKAMLDKPKVSEADSASKTVEQQQQQQPANLLNLEPKSSQGSTNESNLQTKPTLSFGFNQPAVSTTTMEAPNLFAKVASETKPEENKINKNDTPSSFQFLNASKGPSLATTSSMFTFGGPPVVSSNNAPGILPSTNTNAFGKNLDFGSPITVPKIDPGPPVSNPKININFSQPPPPPVATTTAAPAPPSMFDFSANNSSGALKPATQFNFGNSSTINLNANANNNGGAVFGSVPPTFNFMGNTNNNVQQSNSLFSFGSKPNEPNQTSITKPAETGFSFAASNPLSFGMTNPNANPIGPAGGMVPAQPSPFNPTAIDVQQQQQPSSMFSFQPLQNNADFQANQRKFKKAKRRLNK